MRIAIIVLACLILLYVINGVNREQFTDAVPNQFSKDQGNDVKIKYPKAYYYEYENDLYNEKLLEIFMPKYTQYQDDSLSYSKPTHRVLDAFEYVTSDIAKRVRHAPELAMKGAAPIQMVERSLIAFRTDATVTLRFQCVLYRENKYAGKRVEFCVDMIQFGIGLWRTDYLFVSVIDTVSEDKIGIFPLVESDTPFRTEYDSPGFTPTSATSTPVSLSLRAPPELHPSDPDVQRRILNRSNLFEVVAL